MSWFKVSKRAADRLAERWSRLLKGRDAYPWEKREAQRFLYEISKSAVACQMVADLLEIECDPGEAAADYVSQMLRQPTLEYAQRLHERDMALISAGFGEPEAAKMVMIKRKQDDNNNASQRD